MLHLCTLEHAAQDVNYEKQPESKGQWTEYRDLANNT